MRIVYFSKHKALLGAVYFAALVVLAAAGLAVFPLLRQEPAAPAAAGVEPFRCGAADSMAVSLAINVDWGEEYLPDILAVLEENDISATFFLTGRWCDNNAALAADMARAGHELGNHGYSHTSPNASTIDEIIDEISRTEESIRQATGATTRLYAPPSGEEEDHVLQAAAQAGYHTVLWSVDTIDWQKPDAATVVERVCGKIHGGAIILAHPTACTLEALPVIIQRLREEGYSFVTVGQNLAL